MELTSKQRSELAAKALEARRNAYAPYSEYEVGAALLGESGEIYQGANVENAAYPASMCAERSAVFRAVCQGERKFVAIAVATENGGFPCGSCRQVLAEFGVDTTVLIVDAAGEMLRETTVAALLPDSFGPQDLQPT